jgi:hypothetical protein
MKNLLVLSGLLFFSGSLLLPAQTVIAIPLPDVTVWANKCIRGDADLYGLGHWDCHLKAKIIGKQVRIEGKIVFSEGANDFTTIVGAFTKVVHIAHCLPAGEWDISPVEVGTGIVSGNNMGASGPHWFAGSGLIQQAKITTDTFGPDTEKIGGTLQFKPLKVQISPVYAGIVPH